MLEKDESELPEKIDVEVRETSKSEEPKRDPHTVSWHWAVYVIGLGCLLFYEVHLLDHKLPTPVMFEETRDNPHLFSAENARTFLRKLVALGPRVVGDVINEEYSPALIEHEIDLLIKGSHPAQKMQRQRQIGSGSFKRVERVDLAFTSVYVNIQNVMIMLEGSEGKHSILVNCHYDTVSEVEGASDDGISCAVMYEIIRALSSSSTRLKHNVVFLFNGAEETGLQAAHLFLQHEWKEKCGIFINLEASGLGGRSLLFQTGPNNAWLLKYYKKYAPHPHGMAFGEEVFQAGLVPSDTDFRVWNDFGKMAGYDIAFTRLANVYHTKFDSEKYIKLGSYQHMGDNVLALLNSLGNAPELYDLKKYSEGQPIYFDYLGWFIVSYSTGAGTAINIIVIMLACLSITVFIGRLLKWSWLSRLSGLFEKLTRRKSSGDYSFSSETIYTYNDCDSFVEINDTWSIMKELLIVLAAWLLGMGVAVGVTAIVALIINSAAELGIPWFSNEWLIFPFFWCPCIISYCLVPYLVNYWRSRKNNMSQLARTHLNLVVVQFPWILIFFIMTVIGYRSAHIFLLQVFFTAMGNFLQYLTPLYKTTHKWIWVYLLFQMPSLIINMYFAIIVYSTFNPVIGRSGDINGDLNIALVSSLLCIYITSSIAPLVLILRRPAIVFCILTVTSIAIIITALTSDIGHPYSVEPGNPKPQRYSVLHTLRELRNDTGHVRLSETGYFILNLDENSPDTIPSKSKNNIRRMKLDCENELLCAVPFYTTRTLKYSAESSWIPAPKPLQPIETELVLKNGKRTCDDVKMLCSYSFYLKGPDRMTLTFSPREGVSLVDWTLNTDLETPLKSQNRPVYLLHIVHGKMERDFELTLEFKVTSKHIAGDPVIDIGLASNHVHHEKHRTKDFQAFLDSLPDWTDRTGWISAYKGYVL